ncbi:hypothetical protein F8388_026065 [Cannabis sativa]|uniref:Phytosulfokine-beta n=1 Tax=Cannabis sativa TaxID=3483 RepID=A0A7J6EBF5_CANSA|nr:hypothetical protein F8388_026065 [Cannabis sativa]KAF4400559.1 hypothetical protein G4B88_023352 [Cannabis sativa]
MRFQIQRLAILLVLFFCMAFLVHGKVDPTSNNNSTTVASENSLNVGRAECGKEQNVECKKRSDQEDDVFEDEDYIYTNSLP